MEIGKEFVRIMAITVLPLIFWICIIATGYGCQSLSQIVEVPIVYGLSLFVGYHARKLKIYQLISILFIVVILVRIFMPCIPE